MTLYEPKEVAKHNHANSLWIVHKGNVYDVTEFAGVHPGGREYLLEYAGGVQDVAGVMQDAGTHQHTKAAYNVLKHNYIGKVRPSVTGSKHASFAHQNGHVVNKSMNNNEEEEEFVDDHGDEEDLTSMKGYKEDELIDWSKPIYWQVGELGENYKDWVHNPVDKPLRLFHSDFCEFFSKAPWQLIPILWFPIVSFLIYLSYCSFDRVKQVHLLGLTINCHHLPIIFLCGPFFWTLFEYVIHRWLFHKNPPARFPFIIRMHFILHGQHHKCPFERYRLVFPPVPASIFGMLIYLMYMLTLPQPVAEAICAGTIFGYVMYDLTHYYLHHGSPTRSNFIGKYFQRMKHYHVRHHFDNQLKGFGISSKLWDYPFNTLIKDHQS